MEPEISLGQSLPKILGFVGKWSVAVKASCPGCGQTIKAHAEFDSNVLTAFAPTNDFAATIVIHLDPSLLPNLNLDIRYVLTDLLVARTNGQLEDDGYDYVGKSAEPCLQLYLRANNLVDTVSRVIEVMKNERVLDIDLSAVPVAIDDGEHFRVVHPLHFAGSIPRPERL